MVRCIGEVLCLEADSMLDVVGLAGFAGITLDPVAGIDLQSGHGGPHLHRSSVCRNGCRMLQWVFCLLSFDFCLFQIIILQRASSIEDKVLGVRVIIDYEIALLEELEVILFLRLT